MEEPPPDDGAAANARNAAVAAALRGGLPPPPPAAPAAEPSDAPQSGPTDVERIAAQRGGHGRVPRIRGRARVGLLHVCSARRCAKSCR